jgi:hypothetical protein
MASGRLERERKATDSGALTLPPRPHWREGRGVSLGEGLQFSPATSSSGSRCGRGARFQPFGGSVGSAHVGRFVAVHFHSKTISNASRSNSGIPFSPSGIESSSSQVDAHALGPFHVGGAHRPEWASPARTTEVRIELDEDETDPS